MDGSSLIDCGNVRVVLTPISVLKRHEEMDGERARKLLREITKLGFWTQPLLVEETSNIILDGHHRFWCAQEMDLDFVPTHRVSYGDPALSLTSWRPDVVVTEELVMAAAASGRLLPKKTSRHAYALGIEPCNISLVQLKRRRVA